MVIFPKTADSDGKNKRRRAALFPVFHPPSGRRKASFFTSVPKRFLRSFLPVATTGFLCFNDEHQKGQLSIVEATCPVGSSN